MTLVLEGSTPQNRRQTGYIPQNNQLSPENGKGWKMILSLLR